MVSFVYTPEQCCVELRGFFKLIAMKQKQEGENPITSEIEQIANKVALLHEELDEAIADNDEERIAQIRLELTKLKPKYK